MATITVSAETYNVAKSYADFKKISVDELIVSLINKLAIPKAAKQQQVALKPQTDLHPDLQALVGFAKPAQSSDEDLNGRQAREEYLMEKYGV
ncbi:MAG: hypothetical protein IJ710_08950 [Prevotella sp.]|nr:hypothetical protein [Prevotella sp.]